MERVFSLSEMLQFWTSVSFLVLAASPLLIYANNFAGANSFFLYALAVRPLRLLIPILG